RRAVGYRFPAAVCCWQCKPVTGHTRGATGALEAAGCGLGRWPFDPEPRWPPHVGDGQQDPALPTLELVAPGTHLSGSAPRRMMSNSFAFGGNNISLILGDAP